MQKTGRCWRSWPDNRRLAFDSGWPGLFVASSTPLLCRPVCGNHSGAAGVDVRFPVQIDAAWLPLETFRESDRDAVMNQHRQRESSTGVAPVHPGADQGPAVDELLWDGTRQAIGRAGLEILGELAVTRRTIIFEARESRSDRALILKVLTDPDDRPALTAFRRERRVLSAEFLPSQLVPRYVTSVAGEEMQPFLVTEKIEGRPLIEAAQSASLARRVELARSLFSTVDTLHASNLLHGNLSASHILIDDQGRIRLVGFGQARPLEAGSQVRAALDKSKPANRLMRLPQGIAAKSFDGRSDLRAGAAVAFQLLTGRPAATISEGEMLPGDHSQATWQSELGQAGVPEAVSQIVTKALRLPDERGDIPERHFASAGEVADELSHWLDQRRRRQGRFRSTVACSLVASLAWALGAFVLPDVTSSPNAAELQRLEFLESQAAGLQSREYPAVAASLQRVEELSEQRATLLAAGDESGASEQLSVLLRELTTLVETGREVERSVPVRKSIGQLLGSVPWVRESRFISERLTVLEARFRRSGQQLESGQTADAWQLLQTLERDLAALVRDNAEAAAAERARARFVDLREGIADRLKTLDGYPQTVASASDATTAWNDGDWALATDLFDQTRQQLRVWLRANETLDEQVARRLADTELVNQLAERFEQITEKLDAATDERDDAAALATELGTAGRMLQAELNTARDAGRQLHVKIAEVSAARNSVQTELKESGRSLQQAKAELRRLRSELATLGQKQREQQVARDALEQRIADLDRKLTTAERIASDAGERAESLRNELELWKQFGGTETAAAIELARQEDEIASRVARLSGQDRQRAELLVREAQQRLADSEQQRSKLLQKFSPDSSAVRALDGQLPKLEATLVAAVRGLSEIEADLYSDLQQQIATLRKQYEHLTKTLGLKSSADEPQEISSQIRELTAKADGYETSLARLEAIDRGDRDAAREFARSLNFSGQSAGQRSVILSGSGDVALRWISADRSRSGDSRPTSLRNGFWILETEVTQALFKAVVGQTLEELHSQRTVEVDAIGNRADHVPIYFASYDDARRFCERLTEHLRREGAVPSGWQVALPSEAQWEHAANAGRPVANPAFVDEFRLAETAWFNANSNSAAQQVGRKAPNAWGLQDMIGNVYEWVRSSSSTNEGVVRGASWGSPAEAASVSSRRVVDRDFRSSEVGFRFVIEQVSE